MDTVTAEIRNRNQNQGQNRILSRLIHLRVRVFLLFMVMFGCLVFAESGSINSNSTNNISNGRGLSRNFSQVDSKSLERPRNTNTQQASFFPIFYTIFQNAKAGLGLPVPLLDTLLNPNRGVNMAMTNYSSMIVKKTKVAEGSPLRMGNRDKIMTFALGTLFVGIFFSICVAMWCFYCSPSARMRQSYAVIPSASTSPSPLTPVSAVAYLAQNTRQQQSPLTSVANPTANTGKTEAGLNSDATANIDYADDVPFAVDKTGDSELTDFTSFPKNFSGSASDSNVSSGSNVKKDNDKENDKDASKDKDNDKNRKDLLV